MPTEVILPRVDMDMTEGMIAAWHVAEGDEVREGTLIFEIETSKATMEIDAPASGFIRHISVPVGQTVPVGTAVAWIYASGEAVQEPGDVGAPSEAQSAQTAASVEPDRQEDAIAAVPVRPPAAGEPQPLRATPAARRVAREKGLTLASVNGSGPHGRIGEQDVLRANHEPVHAARASGSVDSHLHTVWLRKSAVAPLVMLHGFAADSNSWRPFAHALEPVADAGLGMLGIDLPLHAGSAHVDVQTLDDVVSAIERTLAAAGVDDFHLLGHSLGGAMAIAVAAALPRSRIRSVTLLAPAGLGPECNGAFIQGLPMASRRASLVPWLKCLFARASLLDEAFIATAEQQLARVEVRERLASLANLFFPDGVQSLDLRELLDAIQAPVRIVWGNQDRILPVRHAEGLPGRIGLHRFSGVGHLPHVEARDEVAIIVAENVRSGMLESSRHSGGIAVTRASR